MAPGKSCSTPARPGCQEAVPSRSVRSHHDRRRLRSGRPELRIINMSDKRMKRTALELGRSRELCYTQGKSRRRGQRPTSLLRSMIRYVPSLSRLYPRFSIKESLLLASASKGSLAFATTGRRSNWFSAVSPWAARTICGKRRRQDQY
jgi:hypothetical protein